MWRPRIEQEAIVDRPFILSLVNFGLASLLAIFIWTLTLPMKKNTTVPIRSCM